MLFHYCPFLLSVVCLLLEVPSGGQSSCWASNGLGGGHDVAAAAALSTLTIRTLFRLLYLDNQHNLNSGLVSFGGLIAGGGRILYAELSAVVFSTACWG